MGTVHQLIEVYGKTGAAQQAASEEERRAIEAAAQYMADEDSAVACIFSGWAQAALPHRRLANDAVWQLQTQHVTLLVEPGRRILPQGEIEFVGVPYGSRARLIMLYLQSEALRTGRREIELGRSLNAWLLRLGIPRGGKSFNDVREQADRISRCHLTFHTRSDGGKAGLLNQNILDGAMFVSQDERQGSLFIETARLSEVFYEQLTKHPVPIQESAVRAINNNSMAIDIYCWLAYRLHSLHTTKLLTWPALKAQFGAGFQRADHFKTAFQNNLALAQAVYPEAKIEVGDEGVTLRPSKPPVPFRSGGRAISR